MDSLLFLRPTDATVLHKQPILRLSLYVLGKLEYLMQQTQDEIAGFFLFEDKDDPLAASDFCLVKQYGNTAFVEMDGDGLRDFYIEMAKDRGLEPHQYSSVWAHTHPNMSAKPSSMDETTFHDMFCNRAERHMGSCRDWAGMFIRSRTGENYLRLAFNPVDGPGIQIVCPVAVDPNIPFKAADKVAWKKEFDDNVRKRGRSIGFGTAVSQSPHLAISTCPPAEKDDRHRSRNYRRGKQNGLSRHDRVRKLLDDYGFTGDDFDSVDPETFGKLTPSVRRAFTEEIDDGDDADAAEHATYRNSVMDTSDAGRGFQIEKPGAPATESSVDVSSGDDASIGNDSPVTEGGA